MPIARLGSMLLTAFVSAAPCVAQEIGGCPGPDTSTRFDACINDKEADRFDQEIALKLLEISTMASSEAVKAELLTSQAEWEKFRSRACTVQQSLLGGANSVNHARCMRFLTKQRLEYLETTYR